MLACASGWPHAPGRQGRADGLASRCRPAAISGAWLTRKAAPRLIRFPPQLPAVTLKLRCLPLLPGGCRGRHAGQADGAAFLPGHAVCAGAGGDERGDSAGQGGAGQIRGQVGGPCLLPSLLPSARLPGPPSPACHSCGCVVLCCAVLSACSGRGMPAGAGCSHFSQPAAHAQACVLAPAGRCP